jgi:hypothetical protein
MPPPPCVCVTCSTMQWLPPSPQSVDSRTFRSMPARAEDALRPRRACCVRTAQHKRSAECCPRLWHTPASWQTRWQGGTLCVIRQPQSYPYIYMRGTAGSHWLFPRFTRWALHLYFSWGVAACLFIHACIALLPVTSRTCWLLYRLVVTNLLLHGTLSGPGHGCACNEHLLQESNVQHLCKGQPGASIYRPH